MTTTATLIGALDTPSSIKPTSPLYTYPKTSTRASYPNSVPLRISPSSNLAPGPSSLSAKRFKKKGLRAKRTQWWREAG